MATGADWHALAVDRFAAQHDSPLATVFTSWYRALLLALSEQHPAVVESAYREADPTGDHLFEALWCLTARAAVALNDRETMQRAQSALAPAADELAGAGSGLFTLGPVSHYLAELAEALRT